MAKYFNKTRGPLSFQRRDGVSVLVLPKSWSEDIPPTLEGSASLARLKRKGLLIRENVVAVPAGKPPVKAAVKPAVKSAMLSKTSPKPKPKVASDTADKVEDSKTDEPTPMDTKASGTKKTTSKRRK